MCSFMILKLLTNVGGQGRSNLKMVQRICFRTSRVNGTTLGCLPMARICYVAIVRLFSKRSRHGLLISFSAGTHCLTPPTPPATSELEVSYWNGRLVEFHESIGYTCSRGMKFHEDFDLVEQKATCLPNNFWDIPTWKNCTESMTASYFRG